jgi:hypothetical protein
MTAVIVISSITVYNLEAVVSTTSSLAVPQIRLPAYSNIQHTELPHSVVLSNFSLIIPSCPSIITPSLAYILLDLSFDPKYKGKLVWVS